MDSIMCGQYVVRGACCEEAVLDDTPSKESSRPDDKSDHQCDTFSLFNQVHQVQPQWGRFARRVQATQFSSNPFPWVHKVRSWWHLPLSSCVCCWTTTRVFWHVCVSSFLSFVPPHGGSCKVLMTAILCGDTGWRHHGE
jgi:hypothetical protein